jgi:hypothetical protein
MPFAVRAAYCMASFAGCIMWVAGRHTSTPWIWSILSACLPS